MRLVGAAASLIHRPLRGGGAGLAGEKPAPRGGINDRLLAALRPAYHGMGGIAQQRDPSKVQRSRRNQAIDMGKEKIASHLRIMAGTSSQASSVLVETG